MIDDTPKGQTQYLVEGEPVAMSQENKPVAAQKPVARIDSVPHLERDGLYRAEVTLTRKLPAFTDLYANSAPCARCAELEREVAHWKANHDNRVEAARVLIERTDLPLERVKAYKSYVEIQAKLTELEKDIERLQNDSIQKLVDAEKIRKLEGAVQMFLDTVDEPPERNCSCHLSPPCSDCVDYGGLREAFELARGAMRVVQPYDKEAAQTESFPSI